MSGRVSASMRERLRPRGQEQVAASVERHGELLIRVPATIGWGLESREDWSAPRSRARALVAPFSNPIQPDL